jgi:hypothetical protein
MGQCSGVTPEQADAELWAGGKVELGVRRFA